MRRSQPADPGLDQATADLIRRAAAQNPSFTPAEVCAVLRNEQHRDDITTDTVRYVLPPHLPAGGR